MNVSLASPSLASGWSDDGVDPELAEILADYLAALERGAPADHQQLVAQHPQHAELLAQYAPWVELLFRAQPHAESSAIDVSMPNPLGDFRLLRELGRGGMGIVYEAEQISLSRPVAVKVLPFASMLDARQLTRFKHEALAAAQLHHPNIVPVFAVGCERGLHFFVMQRIDGQTLEQHVEAERSLDADSARDSVARLDRHRTAARWIAQAADALDHAHNQGIVHRDVKPSNFMIDGDDNVWVTDFGLARTPHNASMTATGEMLGTLRYMSPEQLRSKPGIVDHRTDVYSLGLTLYELLALRPAFDGQTQQELIGQIAAEDPPALGRPVPRDLASIVAKATAKTPDARYASAADMADDLRRFLDGRPTLARPATWRDHAEKWVRRHARLVASATAVLALAMVCAVIGAVLVWRAQDETQRALVLANDNHRRAEDNLRDARRAVDDLFTGASSQLAEIPGAETVRRRLLAQALAYYQRFAARADANPQVRAETAAAHYRCGQIDEQLGDDPSACKAYEQAERLWTALAAPGALDHFLRPRALCQNNLGLIHLRAGRVPRAVSHLRAALQLAQEQDARVPDDRDSRRDLALCYSNLGMALGQSGETDEALGSLRIAARLQQQMAAPSVTERGDRAATYNQIGYLRSASAPEEASDAFRRAADEFRQLADEQPHVLRWQSLTATALNNLAALAAAAGRSDQAEADYRRALDLQTQLTQRAPDQVAYPRDLAVAQNNFAHFLARQGNLEQSILQFQAARDILLDLAQRHDASAEYASRLGAVCNNLGLALVEHGAADRARTAFDEAIHWQRRAVELSPQWSQAQTYLDQHTANRQRLLQTADAVDQRATSELSD